ncbi:unnamed protein product, partial [Laminaria digitata]
MVGLCRNRCSHGSCRKQPSFNVEGSKTAATCKQHAMDGIVNVNRGRRCSSNSCTRRPRWGVLSDGAASVCSLHKSDI